MTDGGPERRMNALDNEYWGGLLKTASEIKDERKRRLAVSIFESGSVEEASEILDKLQRGTWLNNLFLGASAVIGGFLGFHAQRMIDIRAKGVPVTGVLGLAGVVPGLAMDRTVTARNTVGLGGLLFLAGAGLYTSTTPLTGEEGQENQESEDA